MNKEEAINKVKEIMDREFSDEQIEIITHYGKPLNGIAGAGSGKTTVTIGKIFYLMLHKNYSPNEILSITFSKKASDEIAERYQASKRRLPNASSIGSPMFRTFHAFFYSILRNIPEYRGIDICSYNDFLYELLKVVESNSMRTDKETLEQYMRVRGVLINYNVSNDGLLDKSDLHLLDDAGIDIENYLDTIKRYNDLKKINNRLDFDDMQSLLLDYLKTNPQAESIVMGFQNSFKHIILDEYQDVSPIQIEIIDLLMSDVQIRNLVAVGDDDQSIYSFRGSQSEYIINFPERYKNARRKYISKNYRCKSNILNEVIPMISKNKNRVEKDLCASNEGGLVEYLNTDDPSEFKKLKEMLEKDVATSSDLSNDVAILVRFNRNRMLLADTLAEIGIPVDILSSQYLLQNNAIYKSLFGLATAIKHNDVYLLKTHKTKCLKTIPPAKLDDYIKYKENFVEDILNGKLRVSDDEKEYVRRIYSSENSYVILANTWMLVRDFYEYMVDKNRLKKKDVNSTLEYILGLTKSSDGQPSVSWDSLLKAESYKKAYLTDFIGDNNVLKIHTFHSVKGLEFKKVYLYGLDSDIVSIKDWKLDKLNKRNMKKGVFDEKASYSQNRVKKALSNFDTDVEEERRVFYVACTRAIDELYICYSKEAQFALLREMATYKEKTRPEEPTQPQKKGKKKHNKKEKEVSK